LGLTNALYAGILNTETAETPPGLHLLYFSCFQILHFPQHCSFLSFPFLTRPRCVSIGIWRDIHACALRAARALPWQRLPPVRPDGCTGGSTSAGAGLFYPKR